MSGGAFNYDQSRIRLIWCTIQSELDRQGELREREYWMDKDEYHETYDEEVVELFKKGVEVLKEAEVYAQRIDWFLSGDDGEENFKRRLKEELEKLKKVDDGKY